jgi:hypothetical protein
MIKKDALNQVGLPELPEVANNRSERRAQLKHFTKMLKDHESKMPKFNISEKDPAKRQDAQMKIMAWGGMKIRLQNRIKDLQPKKQGNASKDH